MLNMKIKTSNHGAYAFTVCILLSAWYLIWIIHHELPPGIWPNKVVQISNLFFRGSFVNGNLSIKCADLIYFIIIPVFVLLFTVFYSWREQVYYRKHLIKFSLIIIMAVLQLFLSGLIYKEELGWYAD